MVNEYATAWKCGARSGLACHQPAIAGMRVPMNRWKRFKPGQYFCSLYLALAHDHKQVGRHSHPAPPEMNRITIRRMDCPCLGPSWNPCLLAASLMIFLPSCSSSCLFPEDRFRRKFNAIDM